MDPAGSDKGNVQMTNRTQKLDLIKTIIREHIGWRNAISMKDLCKAVELTPSKLKADRHNPHAGYIPELKRQGFPVLSCNGGYYLPRDDPEGQEEDYKKHESRLHGHARSEMWAVGEAKRAPRYAGEMKLFERT